jgi:hypothetical protein
VDNDALQRARDELFEKAKVGVITGEEADAEAIALGLGSLSRQPSENAYRPEAETHWTLPMAVAWIAYLDLNEVREWSEPYRAECWHWLWQRWRVGFDGPVYEGWHLEQRSKPSLALLSIGEALDANEGEAPKVMSIKEARESLWMALREGFFVGSGIDSQTGRRVEIPALAWHDLVSVQGPGERDEVRQGLMGDGYTEVLMPSAALRGYWRKPIASTLKVPATMRPDGDGYMPLYCAAQWIATEGGTKDFEPDDPLRWRAAFDTLLAAITSTKVHVVGLRGGEREKIAGHIFAGIQVDYPFPDPDLELLLGNELYLRCIPYLDEEHWRKGFDDALIQRHEDKWTKLMVDKAEIRRLWPGTAKKSSLSVGALPLSMSPAGDGYMPLYCAAEWIATQGGKVDFDIAVEEHWPSAFEALLAAIASERVRATGTRNRLREVVPAAVFSDLRVFYPSGNATDTFLGTGEPYLQSWPYNEDEWRDGYNDKITSEFEDQWSALMVEKGDVRALWPFDNQALAPLATGMPGRPSKAKHLIDDELARRGQDGTLAVSVALQAAELLAWLIKTHSEQPRPTKDTIENNIRSAYRRLKNGTKR